MCWALRALVLSRWPLAAFTASFEKVAVLEAWCVVDNSGALLPRGSGMLRHGFRRSRERDGNAKPFHPCESHCASMPLLPSRMSATSVAADPADSC